MRDAAGRERPDGPGARYLTTLPLRRETGRHRPPMAASSAAQRGRAQLLTAMMATRPLSPMPENQISPLPIITPRQLANRSA